MDSMSAFANNMLTPEGTVGKVFDWDLAAELIKEDLTATYEAGLQDDMEWTGGTIFENGKPVLDSYTYLYSRWATPILVVNGVERECWKSADTEPLYNSDTKWPQSALDVLQRPKLLTANKNAKRK